MTPTPTPWKHSLHHQIVASKPRQYAPDSFREADSLQHEGLRLWPFVIALAVSGSILAVIGIAVFATVGVLAGFIER
jgi:hypothetical protein